MAFKPHATYSADADAAYVYLSAAKVVRTHRLDDLRMIDYASDGRVVGVEFLWARSGVEMSGVPDRERVESLLKDLMLNTFA